MSNTDLHYLILGLIMLISGLFGGIANYLILYTEPRTETAPLPRLLFLKSVLLGIAASFMVPLFLTTISSELLAPPAAHTFHKNYLVLIGFCLLASVLSKQFIENLSQKVIKAEEKAENAANKASEAKMKVESIEESLTENDMSEDQETHPLRERVEIVSLDDQIIKAIRESKYVYRSTSGIVKDFSSTDRKVLIDTLERMVTEGRLESKPSVRGKKLYKISNA